VILWLHGQHVGDYRKNLFGPDTNGGVTNLRDSIDAAAKDVVLVVPFLGHSEGKTQPLSLPDTNGKGIEGYLAELLGASQVSQYLGKSTIDTLVLGCHSAGGNMMRAATGRLGGLLDKQLKECWGYDCMYYDGHVYACWAAGLPCKYIYFYQGGGSYADEFRAFWEYAYGTPQNPQSPRLDSVFLAPGARSTPGNKKFKPSVAIDNLIVDEVFRPNAAIELKLQNNQPLTPYEEYRLELDKLLDKNQWEWQQRVHTTVYEHYDTVKHLFRQRVERIGGKPALGAAHVIARCQAGKPVKPPPPAKPKQGTASAGRRK
jgi:hypothetical protein